MNIYTLAILPISMLLYFGIISNFEFYYYYVCDKILTAFNFKCNANILKQNLLGMDEREK